LTLRSIRLADLRGYAALEVEFGPGPHLVWGPNAAGKTSLLEAIVLAAWGHSHRTATDAELVRWGADLARVEATVDSQLLEVVLVRPGSAAAADGGRKRIRVNGVPRRPAALGEHLRIVVFAPEDMLLVVGSPALRRSVLDRLASHLYPAYASDLATYSRALQQRQWAPACDSGGTGDPGRAPVLGSAVPRRRRGRRGGAASAARRAGWAAGGRTCRDRARGGRPGPPHAAVPDERAAGRGRVRPATRWLAGSSRRPTRKPGTGRRSSGRTATTLPSCSRGGTSPSSPRAASSETAILALKMAELDLLTALGGRPPLLLLDDVFSELDPARRAHLVRRIAELPQAFVTTTTLDDLDPALRAIATSWEVRPPVAGAGERTAAGVSAGTADGATLAGPRAGVA